MATFNLKRNSRVFFTTNVAAGTNKVNTTGFTAANTQELTVLDGFTFNQGTTAAAITISEAGSTPVRGQRSFNTALNPVDFSFSTYIRPNVASSLVAADESVLWNALFGTHDANTAGAITSISYTTLSTAAIDSDGLLAIVGTGLTTLTVGEKYRISGFVGNYANQYNSDVTIVSTSATGITAQYGTAPTSAAISGFSASNIGASGTLKFNKTTWVANAAISADTAVPAAYSEVTPFRSNANQLLAFGMVMVIDGTAYLIDNCAMDQASIDFGLDGIATVAWTGKGTQLNQITLPTIGGTALLPTFSGSLTGTATGKSAQASTRYITNKLSTVGITKNIGGVGAGNTTYNLALTGGSLQISNNLAYVTPANMGVLNVPIGYYTGTRAITGTINAYLRTGGGVNKNTGDLLNQVLTDATVNGETEAEYKIDLAIGGSNNATRVETLINGASLQVPTVDVQDVVSTVITFTAQGTDAVLGANANYDLENTNDMRIRYFSN